MASQKREEGRERALERVGREVLRASGASAEEAERVAASGFLYARVRARIAAERERREESEWWRAAFAVLWRAVPATAAVAALAFALLLFATAGRGRGAEAAFLSPSDVGVEGVVFDDGRGLSNDEVLETILEVEGAEREGQR